MLLLVLIFTGIISLSIILIPSNNNTAIRDIIKLAYIGSLFLGGIMGYIVTIASIKLKYANWVLVIEMTFVLIMLYLAFYLLLFLSTFYLNN